MDRREVLITRPAMESEPTAAAVRALGFTPVATPFLQVAPREVVGIGKPAAIVVTSGNAVPSMATLPRLPVFAVGDATAARVRASGFNEVLSAGGDAAALAALVRARCPANSALLFVTGERQGSALARELRESGFRVLRRVGYVARPVGRFPATAGAALRAGRLRAATFLSAETARAFVRLVPETLYPALAEVDALAIGGAAADALALLPWRRVRVSLGPTLEQVLALL